MLRLLWVAHVVIPLGALRVEVTNSALPKEGHVAILLRGQAFRHGRKSEACQKQQIPAQLNATDSLIDKIVAPLERNQNTVEFFIVNGNSQEHCPMFEELLMPKFGKRVAAIRQYESLNQSDSMIAVLEEFRFARDPQQYDLILIVRHDDYWKQSISEWPTADFDKFNLFSECGEFKACMSDIFFMMPGSRWKGFRDAVGTPRCFDNQLTHGHYCGRAILKNIGQDNISFITDWRPKSPVGNQIRQKNGVADLSRYQKMMT